MWYGIYFFVMPVFAGWLSTANHNIRVEIGRRVGGGVSPPENGNKLKKYIYKKKNRLRLRRWRRRRQSAEEREAQQHQQPARDTRLGLTMGTSDRFLFYFFIFKLLTSFCGFTVQLVFSSRLPGLFSPIDKGGSNQVVGRQSSSRVAYSILTAGNTEIDAFCCTTNELIYRIFWRFIYFCNL